MTKAFFTFKIPYFWTISPTAKGKKSFPTKFVTHNLIRISSTMPKIQRILMIRFHENMQTKSTMEGQADPIWLDPSSYCQGSSKYNCSRLTFKSQRCQARCWSNQKLLPHGQHAKKSAQFINSSFRSTRF